jgi:hypothetical protein
MSEIDPPRESEIDPPREKVSLLELAWTFNHIALASFGGGLSAWSRAGPEHPDRDTGRLRRRAVGRRCPGAIVGGLIATVAMLLPAASLMYVITLFWQKAQKSKWRIAVEKGSWFSLRAYSDISASSDTPGKRLTSSFVEVLR